MISDNTTTDNEIMIIIIITYIYLEVFKKDSNYELEVWAKRGKMSSDWG